MQRQCVHNGLTHCCYNESSGSSNDQCAAENSRQVAVLMYHIIAFKRLLKVWLVRGMKGKQKGVYAHDGAAVAEAC